MQCSAPNHPAYQGFPLQALRTGIGFQGRYRRPGSANHCAHPPTLCEGPMRVRFEIASGRVSGARDSHITPEEIFEGSRVVSHNRSLRSLPLEHEGVVPVSCPKDPTPRASRVRSFGISCCTLLPLPSRGHLWLPSNPVRWRSSARGASPKFRGSSVMTPRAAALCQAGLTTV